jgi:hypothetical protein
MLIVDIGRDQQAILARLMRFRAAMFAALAAGTR